MLNHIIVAGRLTKDPELRKTQSGVSVVSFTVACDRDFKNSEGTRDTDFITITAWRSTAEFVEKYFTKGRMAIVSGRLQNRSWTDKNGDKRISAEILADNVYFGDSKVSDSRETTATAGVSIGAEECTDEDLPF